MATFGQGINPQLGAIDYSPILRGSLAGAEMAAKGSQMIGQGLANLGQELEAGLKKRGEYKNSVTSAKKLIAGLKTLNIPEEVKTQMGVLGAQIDDPNISLSEQSAIATRLTSLADGIVGLGLKQSFENAKNKRIGDAITAAQTTQTPEAFIASANRTLAGKTEKPFESEFDMSKIGTLIDAGMSVSEIAALSNARSNAIIAGTKGVTPKTAYEIELLKERTAAAKRSNNAPVGGFRTEKEARDSVGGTISTTGTQLYQGLYYPIDRLPNQEGAIVPFVGPDKKAYKGVMFKGQLVAEDTKIPIYGSKDILGQTNTPTFNAEWLKSQGIETSKPSPEDAVIEDPAVFPDGKLKKTPIRLRLSINGLNKR